MTEWTSEGVMDKESGEDSQQVTWVRERETGTRLSERSMEFIQQTENRGDSKHTLSTTQRDNVDNDPYDHYQ